MTVLEGIILGLVQGFSEFLPISSSGHLVMLQRLFGVEEGVLTFSIAVHVATLIPVFVVFWKDILYVIKNPLSKLTLLLIAGTIPTVLIAFLFGDLFEGVYATGASLGFGFILTGLILWYSESVKVKGKSIDKMSYTDAAVVGIAQGIAILPAVSRSGSTIAGALFRGIDRQLALKFSFIMSIPPILGAALLDTYKLAKQPGGLDAGIEMMPLIFGMIAAAVSGYIAVRFMVKILLKGSLRIFSYYVFSLGTIVLIDQIFFGRFFGRLF